MDGQLAFSNIEAEKAVLGSAIASAHDTMYLKELLRIEKHDFSNQGTTKVFEAIKRLYTAKEAIDLIAIDNALMKSGGEEGRKLMAATLNTLTSGYTPWELPKYIDIVLECSIRRQVAKLANDIHAGISDTTREPADVITEARLRMKDIQAGKHQWVSLPDVMIAAFDNLEKRRSGELVPIGSNVGTLDKILGGFFPGEFTVIGARPAIGKSALAANIALSAAKQGKRVGIVSREMSDIQYGQRVLSRESGVDGTKIRQAALDTDDLELIVRCMSEASVLPIEFLFTVSDVERVRIEVERRIDTDGLDMLVVDYLQLMRSTGRYEADRLRVAHISHMLKDITVDLGIPVIALAQVGRQAVRMPTLADLRDSGDIEQDADVVIFIHEPKEEDDPYIGSGHLDAFRAMRGTDLRYIALNVAKQRQGPSGFANVAFDPSIMRYTALDTWR